MKRFTFFLTLLLTFFIGATSAWAGAQDIPQLSTDGAMHYYAIKNTRTGKYLYYNGDNDYLRQSYLLHHNCIFYFKAGSTTTTTNGVTALKIYNLAASTAMAGFNSWNTTGNDWYVKAASNGNTLGIAFGSSNDFGNSWNSYDSEGKIGNWSIDGGSLFTIEELNNQAVLNIFKSSLDVWKCLGYSTTNDFYNTFNNVYELYKDDTTGSTANMITLGSAYQTFINAAPESTIVLISNKLHTDKFVYAGSALNGSTAKDSYSYEWTLLKQPHGSFKIYNAYANKYAGALPTSGGWSGKGYDVVVPLVEDVNVAQDYELAAGIAEGYVTFNTLQGGSVSDNNYSLHMGGSGDIVRWGATADASNFKFTTELTDIEQAWNDAIIAKATKRSGTFVGTLNASNITPATTKLSQATDRNAKIAAFKELEAAMQATENRIAPESGKYYTISSADYTDKYWVEKYGDTGVFGGNNLYSQSLEANTVPALWQFEPCTTNGKTDLYYIKAANSGNYLSRIQWQQEPTLYIDVVEKSNSNVGIYDIFNKDVVNKENAVSFVYYTNDARTDRGTARVNSNTGDGKIDSWNNVETGNQFYIKEVTTIPVTITSAGYATINLPMAVTIPEGVKAYTGVKEDNVLNLTEISGSVIPAETPVVLEATAGTYDFNIKYDDATAKPENGLNGTLAPATIADGAAAYILGNGSKGVAFYKVTSTTDRTIGANKAYAGSLTEAASANVLLFNFGGNTTGINNANAANTNSNVYYDLNGRRVLYPAHGIFVKANGQKVLIK